ncbi:hypothetical protein WJX77_009639 [Trebouxia sp. C0004]
MSGVDTSTIPAVNNIMGNLSQSITAFTAPIDVDVKIVQVGGFGQQSYQLALTRTLLQVNTINLNTEVTFPTTAGSALATAAASSLTNTLSSNPGQVYTASGASLLASAIVAITNVTQATSLVTSVETPAAEIGPGPAPVQYLLTANLTCDPTCVAAPVSGRKLLGESSPWATLGVALYDRWQVGSTSREPRRRKLADRPCCTTSTMQTLAEAPPPPPPPPAAATSSGSSSKSTGIVIGIAVGTAVAVLGGSSSPACTNGPQARPQLQVSTHAESSTVQQAPPSYWHFGAGCIPIPCPRPASPYASIAYLLLPYVILVQDPEQSLASPEALFVSLHSSCDTWVDKRQQAGLLMSQAQRVTCAPSQVCYVWTQQHAFFLNQEEEYRERQYGEVDRKGDPKQEQAEGLQAHGELIGSSMYVPDLGARGGTLGSGYFDAAGNWQTYDVASSAEEPSTSREMQGPKRSVMAAVLGNLTQSIFGPQEPTSQATRPDQDGSFDPLFPPQETQVTEFKSELPQYQGVMADYMARLEAAKRKAEALEMQRQQHLQEREEVEASAASASIVAAAAEMEEAGPSIQAPPLSSQPKSGPQGILGDYMSTLEAARARQERQAAAKGKQATAVIPDLDLGDINRIGSGPIDIVLKPQVSRGVNTQLAHLARVAAELKDLAGHVGQRAEGKQVARPDPRKSGIRTLQPSVNSFPRAEVQPIREPLNVEDFSSVEALDLDKKTE